MWIRVRSVDGVTTIRLEDLSKLTKIEDLRMKLVPSFGIEPDFQRLIFGGKQLENGYSLYDYGVNLNDTIQICRKVDAGKEKSDLPLKVLDIQDKGTLNDNTNESDVKENSSNGGQLNSSDFPIGVIPECEHCRDIPTRKCKHCSCCVCGGKHEPGRQILCDECDDAYHLNCLDPPLAEVPQEEWFCPECKTDTSEVVNAGDKLKPSRKRSRTDTQKTRDWGKGMACMGRSKICTVVPPHHFGPIPGIEVGTSWKYRMQVSEAGVHRAPVAGIHGLTDKGACSIVFSAGYIDDKDNGDEFYYSGSGGRDLSGNKRTAKQSYDQELTKMNKALAMSCKALFNADIGAQAMDWEKGKPIRVVRTSKGHKNSKFCPEDGIRYDGIYKVSKYWPEQGKSGFKVWRYLLRRDDPAPAPWTAKGKKRIADLGLTMQYPDGYKENIIVENGADANNNVKKSKLSPFVLPSDVKRLIKGDRLNAKLWKQCDEKLQAGNAEYLKTVEQLFLCICCQDLVASPVTTHCAHNVCLKCLKMSFQAEVYTCPMCRENLGKMYKMEINENLNNILLELFPGYASER